MSTSKLPVLSLLGIACVMLLSVIGPAFSTVYYVEPSGADTNDGLGWGTARRTVQAAMSIAVAGDEIRVAAGVYAENIVLKNGVYLHGGYAVGGNESKPDVNVTTLYGDRSRSVVTVAEGATCDPVFETGTIIGGFTIENGQAQYGGGINCSWQSSPIIKNNIITNNLATISGGGISCWETSHPYIRNNTITHNFASLSNGGGGGIYATVSSQPEISGNTIRDNHAFYGGGIDCYWVSSGSIYDNIIRNNIAIYGGGIYQGYTTTSVAYNHIYKNTAQYGGGIYCFDPFTWSSIAYNRIYGNGAVNGGGVCLDAGTITWFYNNRIFGNGARNGGAIYSRRCSPQVANNTLVGNSATGEGGGLYLSGGAPNVYNNIIAYGYSGVFNDGTSNVTYHNNCVYDNNNSGHVYNAGYNYKGMNDPTGTDGNINANPRLLWPDYGDFHLYYDVDRKSPCVDAGDNNAPGIPDHNYAYDMDGEPRYTSVAGKHWEPVLTTIPRDASGPSANIIDIGADEVFVMADDNTPDKTDENPDPRPFWVYTYATWSPSYRPLFVSPDGSDVADGETWEFAKRHILPAIEDAAALPDVVLGDPANGTAMDGIRPPIKEYPDVSWLFQYFNNSTFGGVIRVKGDPAVPYVENVELSPHVYILGGYPADEAEPADNLRDFRRNTTIIDAMGNGSAVLSIGGFIFSKLDGFTLCNGAGNPDWNGVNRGGGLFCDYSGVTLRDVTITSNKANYGGGIYCNESVPWILNASVSENTSTATDGGGGGIYLKSSAPILWSSVVLGNNGVYGGGIQCLDASYPWLIGSTIAGNSATYGGGIYSQASPFTLANSILAFNSSGILSSGQTPTLDNNCVYGNVGFNYSGIGDPTGRNGNISTDPMLFISRGNIHIQPESPCVDAGLNGYVVIGWTDMDHQQRIFPDGGTTDIGADESDGTSWNTQKRIVRVSPLGNDGNDGSTWRQTVRHIQTAIDILTPEGGEVWVRAGIYNENIQVTQRVFVYGGFNGTEDTRAQRNPVSNTCMIDGGQNGSVVRFFNAGYKQCGIDGFTITNGSGTWEAVEVGGGIYCNGGSPVISNNTIVGNSAVLGAGIYCFFSVPEIINNVVQDNIATAGIGTNTYGGGICLDNYSSARIINNTIVNNEAIYGGGISCRDSSPLISNNIVANGTSGIYAAPGAAPLENYNCVFGNTNYDYSGLTAGANDVSLDPLFVNAASDNYHIQPLSPCLDAGDNSVVDNGWRDMDNEVRVYGGKVDIGADESYSVDLPIFNPDGGSFPTPVSVTITCPTPGAKIYYTTDGSNPDTSDRVVNGPVVVDRNLTLKARAYVNGLRPSGVKSADFKIALAQPSFSPDSGTYDAAVNVMVTCASSDVTIHYTTNGVDPVRTDPVIASGSSILIYKTTTLKAIAFKNGWEPSPVKTGSYVITAVALPSFTPDGGTFAMAQNVTVTCDTLGAVIHYTTNGKDPTEADPVIASGSFIAVDRSLTLKAKAWKTGQTASGIKSAIYTITGNKAIYVKPAGSDTLDGLTWDTAKKTIQAGLNTASNGDEVWVARGEYKGCITLKTGVALYGGFDGIEATRNERDWKVNITIIDGNKAGSVVTAPTGAVATTIIDGFTIKNGIGTLIEASRYGGGIYCRNSSPMIANNIITGNTAYAGAGIYCRDASPVTVNNIISGNTSQSIGAGICCFDSSPSIANNVIVGNTATNGNGGGFYVAALTSNSSLPTITNNIIAFNSSGIYRNSGKPTLVRNCVFGNNKYNYLGLEAGSTDVQADPKFLDYAEGDFHITIDSPCRNTGDDTVVQPGALDMDLQPRIYGTHVDMGADEWSPSTPVNESLRPNSGALGTGSPVIMTAIYSDNDGYANIANCYMIINTAFNGAKGCYVRYDANTKKLYLRNDANSAWIGGFLAGSDNILENSYCKLHCAGTTISNSGADLKVNWKVELKSILAGKTCYAWMLCVDDTNLRDGWDKMGTYSVSRPPVNTSLSPSSFVVSPSVKKSVVVKYSDGDGSGDISACYTLINTTFTGVKACYLYYDASANKLYVRNDANTVWTGGFAPGAANVIENSYIRLYCAETTAVKAGTDVTVSYRLEFKPAISGKSCYIWMMVQDRSGLRDGWDKMGTCKISAAPSVSGFSPATGTITTGTQSSLTSRFSDADGFLNICDCYTLINTVFSGARAAYLRYDLKNNKLYVRNDANTVWTGGYAPGSANVIENSYIRLYCAATTKSGAGANLVVNWKVMIKSGMSGKSLGVWQKVYDEAGLFGGWDSNATLAAR